MVSLIAQLVLLGDLPLENYTMRALFALALPERTEKFSFFFCLLLFSFCSFMFFSWSLELGAWILELSIFGISCFFWFFRLVSLLLKVLLAFSS